MHLKITSNILEIAPLLQIIAINATIRNPLNSRYHLLPRIYHDKKLKINSSVC